MESGPTARVRPLRWAAPLLAALAIILAGLNPTSATAKCDLGLPLVFADLGWNSVRLHNAIAGHIVEHGYGCKVGMEPGGTLDSFERLTHGGVDVMMEVWKDNFQESWDKMEEEGHVLDAGVVFGDAIQGWFVPRYLIAGDEARGIEARAPELKSVHDLARYKHVFADPSDPEKGVFMNCVRTWACEQVNTRKLKAYGLADHFANRHAETGDALVAYITERHAKGLPFVAYYWTPTWVVGAYDLVRLEEPTYDELAWQALLTEDPPGPATAYPVARVYKGVNYAIELESPELLDFIRKYSLTTDMVSSLLARWQGQKTPLENTVAHFFKEYPERWKSWVPEDVALRIDASLGGNP